MDSVVTTTTTAERSSFFPPPKILSSSLMARRRRFLYAGTHKCTHGGFFWLLGCPLTIRKVTSRLVCPRPYEKRARCCCCCCQQTNWWACERRPQPRTTTNTIVQQVIELSFHGRPPTFVDRNGEKFHINPRVQLCFLVFFLL